MGRKYSFLQLIDNGFRVSFRDFSTVEVSSPVALNFVLLLDHGIPINIPTLYKIFDITNLHTKSEYRNSLSTPGVPLSTLLFGSNVESSLQVSFN